MKGYLLDTSTCVVHFSDCCRWTILWSIQKQSCWRELETDASFHRGNHSDAQCKALQSYRWSYNWRLDSITRYVLWNYECKDRILIFAITEIYMYEWGVKVIRPSDPCGQWDWRWWCRYLHSEYGEYAKPHSTLNHLWSRHQSLIHSAGESLSITLRLLWMRT